MQLFLGDLYYLLSTNQEVHVKTTALEAKDVLQRTQQCLTNMINV